jgi:hypothetical protein
MLTGLTNVIRSPTSIQWRRNELYTTLGRIGKNRRLHVSERSGSTNLYPQFFQDGDGTHGQACDDLF